MEIAQTIDNALFEWYSERGLDVPKWRMKKILIGGQNILRNSALTRTIDSAIIRA